MKRGTCELPDTIKFQCGDDTVVSVSLAKAQTASQTVRDLIAERPVDDFCVILPSVIEKKTLDQVAAYIESDCKVTTNFEPIECFLFALQYLQMETEPFHVAFQVDLYLQGQLQKYDGFTEAEKECFCRVMYHHRIIQLEKKPATIFFEPRADTLTHPVYSQLKDMLVYHIFPKFQTMELFLIASIHIWLYKWVYQYVVAQGRRFWIRMTPQVSDRQVFLAYLLLCLYGKSRLQERWVQWGFFPGIDMDRMQMIDNICGVKLFTLIEEAAHQDVLEDHMLVCSCSINLESEVTFLKQKFAFYISTQKTITNDVTAGLFWTKRLSMTYAEIEKEMSKLIHKYTEEKNFNMLSKILVPEVFKQLVAEMKL